MDSKKTKATKPRKVRKPLSPAMAAYWAASVSASVDAAYASGNVVTVVIG